MHVFSFVKRDPLKGRADFCARNLQVIGCCTLVSMFCPKEADPKFAMVEASMSQHIAASRVSSHDSDLAIACHSGVSQVAKWGKLEDALSK